MRGVPPLSTSSRRARRGTVAVLGLALAMVLGSLLGAPAQAADPGVVFSTPDVSRPGHVSGSVRTDKPYVRVQLSVTAVQTDALPVTDGSATYDLPTWGFGSSWLRAVGCTTTAVSSCDTAAITESESFEPRDVVPTVTWPKDRTITTYPTPTITLDDPDGGGSLRVVWVPDDPSADNVEQDVDRNGTSDLTLLASVDSNSDGVGDTSQVADGVGTLILKRCRAEKTVDPYHCQTLDASGTTAPTSPSPLQVRLEVDHSYFAVGNVSTPGALPNVSRPTIGAGTRSLRLPVRVSDPGVYQLTWSVVEWFGETQEWSHGAQRLDLTGTTTTLDLPLDPMPAGRYSVVTWLTRASSVGGSFATQILTAPLGGHPQFDVEDSPPSVTALVPSAPDVFPATDGFRDTTGFTLTGQHEPWTDVSLRVTDDTTGTVVRTLHSGDFRNPRVGPDAPREGDRVSLLAWDGRAADGAPAPAGDYTATATVHDVYGNAREVTAPLHVHAERLVRRSWTTTVTANSARVSSRAGRCSTLRAPASRKWSGSHLYGAGSVVGCRPRTSSDRLVQVTSQVRLPALPAAAYADQPAADVADPARYDTLAIAAYGGASTLRGKSRSTAALRWLRADGRGESARVLPAALGLHSGYGRAATGAVRSDRTVRFLTYATGLSSYDLKAFRLTLGYSVLQ